MVMSDSDLNLDDLERIAKAVLWELPNPWLEDGDGIVLHPDQPGNSWDGYIVCEVPADGYRRRPVRAHIATFDPPTVLALIARLREAEARADAAWEVIDSDHWRNRYDEDMARGNAIVAHLRDRIRRILAAYRQTTNHENRAEEDEFAPGECDGSGTCSNSVEVARLRGQVAELVSDREVILNRGSNHGVQEGQYFAILNPDTIVKVVVVAVEVAPKLTLARTFRTKTLNVGGSSSAASVLASMNSMFNPPKYVETVEKLTLDKNAPRKISPSESVVSKGDPFEEAYEDEVEDVRTITLFEADDRWRAPRPRERE